MRELEGKTKELAAHNTEVWRNIILPSVLKLTLTLGESKLERKEPVNLATDILIAPGCHDYANIQPTNKS